MAVCIRAIDAFSPRPRISLERLIVPASPLRGQAEAANSRQSFARRRRPAASSLPCGGSSLPIDRFVRSRTLRLKPVRPNLVPSDLLRGESAIRTRSSCSAPGTPTFSWLSLPNLDPASSALSLPDRRDRQAPAGQLADPICPISLRSP